MSDNKEFLENEEEIDVEILTLTDEETGEEKDFELLAKAELDGNVYLALVPADEEAEEYVILKATGSDDDMVLETIDDDEEFDRAADFFDDVLFDSEEEE